jgi:hypothetical protein
LLLLLGFTVLAFIFWNNIFLTPLKILVVFFHEISHGLAAAATGGSIHNIQFSNNQSGVCTTAGGNAFLITSAGYLGSLMWGFVLLYFSNKEKIIQIISDIFCVFLIVITVLYVRNTFGFLFGIGVPLAIVVLNHLSTKSVVAMLWKIIGFVSCAYALWDIFDDTIANTIDGSDAVAVANMTGMPPVAWGVIWLLIGGFLSLLFLKKSLIVKSKW